MKKTTITLIALILVLIPAVSGAKPFGKTGTAALQFLKFGVDARAIGMGEAYTAVTDDISSVYWNPAGLAPAYKNEVFFSHTNWPANIYHEFGAASFTNGVSTAAVYGSVLHMDDIDFIDEETFGPTGEQFTNSSIAIGVDYAQQFTRKFTAGVGVKYLRENLYEFSVNSYSIDLGSMYNTGWRNVKIGMALRNFGPDISYQSMTTKTAATTRTPLTSSTTTATAPPTKTAPKSNPRYPCVSRWESPVTSCAPTSPI